MDPVGKSQTSQWSVCANKQQKNQIIQESRSSIDERSFCLSLSRICLAIYQLYALAFEHVRDASLWAHVCASTLRRHVWVCAIHSVGFTPLMQSGTRVPKSLSHDSPIVWVWVWWGSLWAECTVMRCSPAPGRERGEVERYAAEVKWLKWDYRKEILPVLCIRWSLSGLSSRKTQACRVSLSQRNIYIDWVSADCQFTLCFSRFIYLSFYKHGAAQWNEGRRPWMLHKVQRMSWRVFSF